MITQQMKLDVLKIASENYNQFFHSTQLKKDVYIFYTIKKMLARFLQINTMNEKLIMNNLIIVINIFGIERTNQILSIICDEEEFSIVKAFLRFLNCDRLDESIVPHPIVTDLLKDVANRYKVDISYDIPYERNPAVSN